MSLVLMWAPLPLTVLVFTFPFLFLKKNFTLVNLVWWGSMSPSIPHPIYHAVTPVPLSNCMFPLYSTYPAIASPLLSLSAFGAHNTPGWKLYILTVAFLVVVLAALSACALTATMTNNAAIKIKRISMFFLLKIIFNNIIILV